MMSLVITLSPRLTCSTTSPLSAKMNLAAVRMRISTTTLWHRATAPCAAHLPTAPCRTSRKRLALPSTALTLMSLRYPKLKIPSRSPVILPVAMKHCPPSLMPSTPTAATGNTSNLLSRYPTIRMLSAWPLSTTRTVWNRSANPASLKMSASLAPRASH